MKRIKDRLLAWLALTLLVVIGLGGLALLVLAPDYVQARLDGLQPASLESGLHANYAMDPMGIQVQPVSFKAVEEIIADRSTSTLLSKDQIATVVSDMLTPVVKTTATYTPILPSTSPTGPNRNYTLTALAFTSTRPAAATATVPGHTNPTEAASPTATMSLTPTQTVTLVPTPPGTTATSTLRPSATLKPTAILGPTATPKPTGSLPTLTGYPTATNTRPPQSTAPLNPTTTGIFTLTPVPPTKTLAPTHTFTPVPPTHTFTARPPTKTPPAYPPPVTVTALPYP